MSHTQLMALRVICFLASIDSGVIAAAGSAPAWLPTSPAFVSVRLLSPGAFGLFR